MFGKELVSTPAKITERIGPGDSVQVADATAPVNQVDCVLNPRMGGRLGLGWNGAQLLRSAACAAGSRSTGRGSPLPEGSAGAPAASEPACAWAPFAPL